LDTYKPRIYRRKNLQGLVFGSLTVTERADTTNLNHPKWLCSCKCGRYSIVSQSNLVCGRTKSCGCSRTEAIKRANTTHNQSATRGYRIWSGMMTRCLNPKHSSYPRYGGRGITIDPLWTKFTNFISDMGEPPLGHSIEREDNNQGYSKSNCKWATPLEQANNRRNVHLYDIGFGPQSLAQIAARLRIPYTTITKRITAGWTVNQSLELEPAPIRATGRKPIKHSSA
jgi:hypothetical protein